MRILPTLILTVLAAAPAAAATRDYPAQGFSKIELKSAATVTVTAGPRFSVHAEGDPALLRRLTADVRGDTLMLGWLQGGSINGNNDIHVNITMPRVSGAGISGAGTMTIDHVDGADFAGDVSGAGTIRIAQLRVPHTALAMGGTGQIVAAGHTGRLDVHVSGVGSIDVANLAADAGTFDMSGTGHISARVNGAAAVNLSGMGSVVVAGNARCVVRKSGLGSVRCGQ
ncbi:DUF2807 domain-containing protein [Sphingomonas sp. CGMCC 1.13654]|uniref:DUF2807 domain-containing protein n=1 Tax=Sphingomonas chungangi TaxID=2683589 RepID=A0A838KZW5_9SPHN|nr:head GIN domain-containing protein [Sphingomonas chungangi]MBA2932504.1 DUF2807 domain-containing protein [Sphingomonas chungangi]MVW56127.1 hypothetical protein [Sphingomonas chungangi]